MRKSWPVIAIALLSLVPLGEVRAQDSIAVMRRVSLVGTVVEDLEFQLGPRDREIQRLSLRGPGTIRLQAMWSGSAGRLALILNGPGQVGFYARQDGDSPLVIEFTVTDSLFRLGSEWRASIVNFSSSGTANGWLLAEYPGPVLARARTETQSTATGEASGGAEERTIRPDGTVVTRYADGRVKRQKVGECNYTIEHPDGTVRGVACVEVQSEELPELPQGLLAREDLGHLLDRMSANLLSLIQGVVDQPAVDNYLMLEEGKGPIERINLRFEALRVLLR